MILERAVEADYPAIVDLVNVAYRGQGSEASWNVETGILEGTRIHDSLLREDLAARPDAHLLVCRAPESGEIIGTVWLEPVTDGAWYLGLFTVSPALQKQHLGRALLSAAEDFAKFRGARCIRMGVLCVRDALIAWYQRRGYTLTGETEPFPYGDNRFGTPLRDDLEFLVLEKQF
jgi:ribosomal protein S18 acetylase RimI-like enzyme